VRVGRYCSRLTTSRQFGAVAPVYGFMYVPIQMLLSVVEFATLRGRAHITSLMKTNSIVPR
jgi:hypothetical protein